ncbi:hypothetical protein BY458DRAFT_429917 [Sporodiniella umbellata]|nr:hypothetical protein BY458DRAFT_429917 [Sporodiniella umbellata]
MDSANSSSPSHSVGHMNDHGHYPSQSDFEEIVQDYLQNLSSKKRDKALINQERYEMVLKVLKDPRNTSLSTAQFRFWVKKMFQLGSKHVVCHDGKPVATREEIYSILVRAHREAHHGGRDKTSTLVRQRYSWIPKELIARFVRHCPFCISRRNGSQQSVYFTPGSPVYPLKEESVAMASSSSCESDLSYAYSNSQPQNALVSWHGYYSGIDPCQTSTPLSPMQFPVPYYLHQDELKPNAVVYPIMNSDFSFTAPNPMIEKRASWSKSAPSPAMSLSSVSSSSTSSPMALKYSDHFFYQEPAASSAFNLLCHQTFF